MSALELIADAATMLSDRVLAAEMGKQEAGDKFSKTVEEARQLRDIELRPHVQALTVLQERFRDHAIALAETARKCPQLPFGGLMPPTLCEVQVDGINLSWDLSDFCSGKEFYAQFFADWVSLIAAEASS